MDKHFEQFDDFGSFLARPFNQVIIPIFLVSIFSTLMLWSNLAPQVSPEEELYSRSRAPENYTVIPRSEEVEGLIGPDNEKEILIKPAMAGLPT